MSTGQELILALNEIDTALYPQILKDHLDERHARTSALALADIRAEPDPSDESGESSDSGD